MLTKFAIDYRLQPQHNKRVSTHFTDDPIEAEEFLMHLLGARARIMDIRHEGASIDRAQFDRMLQTAAGRIASQLLCESLALDSVQVKDRFGFSA